MAEGRSLTAREAVEGAFSPLSTLMCCARAVALMVREIMELEVAQLAGAELGERAPGRRQAQRNGYRERRWDTRVGEIELEIPRLRTGSYLPSFLEPRRRAEQALVAVVQEAYVNGVSTRKVDRLVEQMGLRGLSKDQVSRMCRGLDEQVEAFRSGRWRAPIRTCGWTRRSSGSGARRGASEGAGDRVCGARDPGSGRCSASMSARPRPRRSGPSSCSR